MKLDEKRLPFRKGISAKIKKSSQQKITILNKEILDILAVVKQDVVLTTDQSNDLSRHQSQREEAKVLKQLEQLEQTATPTTVIPDTNSAQKALKEKLRKIRMKKQVAAKNKFTAAKKRHASRATQSTSLDSGGGGVQTLAQSQNNILEPGGAKQMNASQSQIEVGGGLESISETNLLAVKPGGLNAAAFALVQSVINTEVGTPVTAAVQQQVQSIIASNLTGIALCVSKLKLRCVKYGHTKWRTDKWVDGSNVDPICRCGYKKVKSKQIFAMFTDKLTDTCSALSLNTYAVRAQESAAPNREAFTVNTDDKVMWNCELSSSRDNDTDQVPTRSLKWGVHCICGKHYSELINLTLMPDMKERVYKTDGSGDFTSDFINFMKAMSKG